MIQFDERAYFSNWLNHQLVLRFLFPTEGFESSEWEFEFLGVVKLMLPKFLFLKEFLGQITKKTKNIFVGIFGFWTAVFLKENKHIF